MYLHFFGGRGSSSGKGNGKPPIAKRISEANDIAVRYKLAKKADFTGLSLENANMAIQTIAATKAEFPNMIDLKYVGNSEYGSSDDKKFGKKNRTVAAFINRYEKTLNFQETFFRDDIDGSVSRVLKFSKASKSIAVGTLKGSIDHELGHVLDLSKNFAISNDSRIVSLYNKHTNKKVIGTKDSMRSVLSSYAEKNKREFLAEAWSEYRNSSNPRPVAKTVGSIVEEYMKK